MKKVYTISLQIIGAKDVLKYDSDSYQSKITQLKLDLENACKKQIDSMNDVIINIDNIVIQNEDLNDLILFYSNLRSLAIIHSIFLSGYLTSCDIIQSPSIEKELVGKSTINYISYGIDEIVKFYSYHESFKGIGVLVDLDKGTLNDYKNSFIKSYYVPNSSKEYLTDYYDIKYNEQKNVEVGLILDNLEYAKSRSMKMVRYYLPLIINYLKSFDFNVIKVDENQNLLIESEMISYILIGGFHSKVTPSKLPTYRLVYFILLNEIYERTSDKRVRLNMLIKLMAKKIVRDNLEEYFHDGRVISSSARSKILRDLKIIGVNYG